MKTAVVYYSYEGNCAFAAEQIGSLLGADLLRLHIANEQPRNGLSKYFWGGSMVFLHHLPNLKPYRFDAAAYDLLIFGAPVWAATPAPPMQSFLAANKISGKKVAFFLCNAGGKGKAPDKFRALLAGNTIVSEADFINPGLDSEESKRKIAEWVKSLSLGAPNGTHT